MKPLQSLGDDQFAALAHEAARLPDAPQAWVEAAVDLWPAHSARGRDVARAALRLVAAVLKFDSWAQPAVAFGMRSAATEARHLVLGCENRDIDLRIAREARRPGHESFVVSGQVLGPGESGVLELRRDDSTDPMSTILDDLGEFRLGDVRAGTYVLSLRFGHEQVVLPPITIGPRPPGTMP